MQTYPKKRLEIIIEAPVLRRLERLLTEERVTGYTVLPAIGGAGQEGSWSREGLVGEAGRMVAVVCIVGPERLDGLLERIFALVSRQIGVVAVSDCQVVRGERF